MDYEVYRKILTMVGELHNQGYQRNRISPGMAPSGMYWRCSITTASNISSRNGALISFKGAEGDLIARYSSADGDRYFGWENTEKADPKELAKLFLRRFPRIAEAGYGTDWKYAGWYQWMLKLTFPDTFPIAYADWDLPLNYLSTTGKRDNLEIPLPPPGVSNEDEDMAVMVLKRNGYFKALSKGEGITTNHVNKLLDNLREHLTLYPVHRHIYQKSSLGPKITEKLTRLQIYLATGKRSWGGLVVAFPGTKRQLKADYVGTPYLRSILYPILDLHRRIQKYEHEKLPCIYVLGDRFSDVFLRKFWLLDEITPHVIVLTYDFFSVQYKPQVPFLPDKISESWVQSCLCQRMSSNEGLSIPTEKSGLKAGLLAYELPTWEGTKNPERLDILGYDKEEHSLIAFEIKGPKCGRVDLENLFLQGLEHRNWLEKNKMAVKFILDGPNGKRINTRKRVRLILGFFSKHVPELFYKLRREAQKKDRYLQIDFVKFVLDPREELTITQFKK